jgi:hypothetical protein
MSARDDIRKKLDANNSKKLDAENTPVLKKTIPPSHSALIGATQGATFNFGDEIYGGLASAVSQFPGGESLVNRMRGLRPDYRPVELTDSARERVREIPRPDGAPVYDPKDFYSYEVQRDLNREENQRYQDANPLSYLGGAVVGSVPASFIPGIGIKKVGGVLTTMQKARRAAQAAIPLAVVGGAGASEADTVEGVVSDALADAATSAVLGGGLSAGGSYAGKVASNVFERVAPVVREKQKILAENLAKYLPPNVIAKIEPPVDQNVTLNAARLRLAEILNLSVSPRTVYAQSNTNSTAADRVAARLRSLGEEATVADATGVPGLRELDVLTTISPQIQDDVDRLVRNRVSSRGQRLITAANESLGTNNQAYTATLNGLEEIQREAQKPFRDILKNVVVRVDDDLMNILKREPDAFEVAETLARREGRLQIGLRNLKAGDEIPFDALDTVKRALWLIAEGEKKEGQATAMSRAVNSIRVLLTNKLDDISPKDDGGSIYEQARNAYGGPAQLRSAVIAGRNAMKSDDIALAELTDGMSRGEEEAFRIGALQSLKDKLGKVSGQTELLNMWKELTTSGKLREIFGSGYRKFSADVAKEIRLKRLDQTGQGSQTAARIRGAENTVSALADALPAVSTAVSGNPVPAIGAITNFLNRMGTPQETRNQLANLLMLRGNSAQNELKAVDQFINQLNARANVVARQTGNFSAQSQTQGD